jgi:dTDP-4-dehydrorhamnose reductase
MKVLMTGCNGQLGQSISKAMNDKDFQLLSFSKENLDITNINALTNAIEKLKPHFLINTAAYTNVDGAEKNKDIAYSINQHGPKNLGIVSKKYNLPIIHFSTDFVFDGKSKLPYLTSSKTNPINVYGKSKLLGEKEIIAHSDNFIIIRTSWVFSEFGNNFLKSIAKNILAGKNLSVISDQYGRPTYAGDIAKLVIHIISSSPDYQLPNSTFHYAGDSTVSWYEFAKEIYSQSLEVKTFQSIAQTKKIQAISTSEYSNALAVRPVFSALDATKIINLYAITPSNWKCKIKECLQQLS